MKFRIAAGAAAAALLGGCLWLMPSTASAGQHQPQRRCYITVKVTHNTTSTTAKLTSANPCHRWFWSWGSFEDPGGVTKHDGHGVQSGSSLVVDSQSIQNITGGWAWSDSTGGGQQHTTY